MALRHWLLLALVLTASAGAAAQEDSGDDSFASADSGDEVEASSPPASSPPPAQKAAAVLSVESAESQVISASGKKLSSSQAKHGEQLLKGASLEAGAAVEITFTPKSNGAAFKPQQAMLLLVPEAAADLAAYAVAKAKKDGSHSATVSASLIDKQLGPVGGKVSVTLLLGDPAAPNGLRWELGSVKLPAAQEGAAPAPAYRTSRVQPVSNALPDIAHIFRTPEKRPPAVVSLAFTGLAFAPLAGLFLWLAATGGLSLSLPAGPGALWSLLFHGGIGALLVLYWLFWTKLDLATTLPAAGVIGLATSVVGYKALSALSDARLQQERAGATAAKKAN